MYGLVNQAVRDLVITKFGEEAWGQICSRAGVESADFSAMKSYPDQLTYGLVGAASEVLKIPPDQLLRAFGNFWMTFTASNGYGEMMDMFGSDFRSCLRSLNGMHSHMGAMMPDLLPPRFEVDELAADRIVVHYYSTREGLGPFVIGLLEGLAQKFGDQVQIQYFSKGLRSDHDEFEVEFRK